MNCIHSKFPFVCKLYNSISLNTNTCIKNKMLLYKNILRPIILYSCSIWGFATSSNLVKIQTMQNNTLCAIGKAYDISETALLSEFKIYSIEKSITILITTCYNSLNNIDNNLIKTFLVFDPHQWKENCLCTL